jgi:hypothetical protein
VTPAQKIKALILAQAINMGDLPDGTVITEENVDDLYDRYQDDLRDSKEDVRCNAEKTGLATQFSAGLSSAQRHYEYDEVAQQALDGSWVGWTYWHGGGKFGEPSAIPWIEYAYDLAVTEEEKMVVVRKFTKA